MDRSKKRSLIVKLPSIQIDSVQGGIGSEQSVEQKDQEKEEQPKEPEKLNRYKYGQWANNLGPGYSFGELALLFENEKRKATIISDEATELLVIKRELFNNTIKDSQTRDLDSKKLFIQTHPFFVKWSDINKEQLMAVLKKTTYYSGQCPLRQGSAVNGIHFLKSGRARLSVDINGHRKQYPELFESLKARENERGDGKRKEPRLCEIKGIHMSELTYARRTNGCAAVEKLKSEKKVEVCSVQAGEVFSDIELLLGLHTQIFQVSCTKTCDIYTLDLHQFERLGLKKNPQMLGLMKTRAETKIIGRMATAPGKKVELFPLLDIQLRYLQISYSKNTEEPAVVRRLSKAEMYKIVSNLDIKQEIPDPVHYGKSHERKTKVNIPKTVTEGPEYFKKLMRKRCKEREKIRKQYTGMVQQCSSISREMKDMIINNVKQQIYVENVIKKFSLSWNNDYTWLTRWK